MIKFLGLMRLKPGYDPDESFRLWRDRRWCLNLRLHIHWIEVRQLNHWHTNLQRDRWRNWYIRLWQANHHVDLWHIYFANLFHEVRTVYSRSTLD